jgi:hypothetical protein
MPPKSEQSKNESSRRSRLYSSLRDAARREIQLFHISAVWHMEHPRPLEPRPEKKKKKKKESSFIFKKKSSTALKLPILPSGSTAGAITNQSQCRLLQLPKEIRNSIWTKVLGGHLLFGGTIVDLTSSYKCYSSNDFIHYTPEWPAKSVSLLNLLQTCRQM